jgi:hypothetical protein
MARRRQASNDITSEKSIVIGLLAVIGGMITVRCP